MNLFIDLAQVRHRVMHQEGWTSSRALRAERDYRTFLSEEGTVRPSKDVDLFWHAHILDTQRYEKDCLLLFGEMLHHVPERAGRCRKSKQQRASRGIVR